ncbi:hypothetical protein TRFO_38657 [Tritrichomonas foetus]|uniref:Uncharacterized protein n=1 Tax=Tritrichomonas foetus TaxID=1144522 RepID=A0A1J4JA60_9EUKA|nr:hypothetical protein TRFO_38657 [Tritrichomonas foetus]|eukprot:OHS95111.1 hypothetical protein TRFO_38657 [Tritrichomonas foetus]
MSASSSFTNEYSILTPAPAIKKKNPIKIASEERLLQQNVELAKKNQHLVDQNQVLKRQFDNLRTTTSEFDEITEKNSLLEKQISKLKGQNDDLTQRIEILVQTNEDLTHQLFEAQAASKTLQFSEISNLQKKLEDERKESQRVIRGLNEDLQKVKESNEIQSISLQKNELSFSKIFEAATQKFSILVNNPETLISLLLTNFNEEKRKDEANLCSLSFERTCSMTQTYDNDTFDDTENDFHNFNRNHNCKGAFNNINNKSNRNEINRISRDKKIKLKIKKLKKVIEILKIEKNSIVTELNKKQENQIADLNSNMDQLKDVIKKQTERIEKLVDEKKNLIQENGKLTAQLEFINLLPQQQKKKVATSNFQTINMELNSSGLIVQKAEITPEELHQLKMINEKLRGQLSNAISKIKLLEDDRARLKFTTKSQKQNIVELSADIQHLNSDKKEMNNNISDLEQKLANMIQKHRTAALTAQQQKDLLDQQNSEFEKLKLALLKCQNVASQQFDEITKHQNEREKLVTLMKRQNFVLEQYEKKILTAHNQTSDQKNQLNRINEDQNNENERLNNNLNIHLPPNAFECNEFPDELADLVSKLASKNNLRTIPKIKQILLIIVQYYTEQLNEHDKKLNSEKEKNSKLNEKYKNLTDFLIQLFPQIDLDFDVIDNEYKHKLSDYIALLHNQNSEPKEITSQHNNYEEKNREEIVNQENRLKELLSVLNCDSVNEAKSIYSNLRTRLTKYVNKLKKEKIKRKQVTKEAIQRENELCEELESTKVTLSEIEHSSSSIELKREGEKSALLNQIEKLKNENEVLKDENTKFDVIKNHLHCEIKEKAQKVAILEAQLADRHKELKNTYRSLELLQQQTRKKDLEVQELRSTLKLTIKQSSDRLKTEREILQQRFEQVVEPLKVKNTEFQSAVNDLNDTITALEADNMKLRKQLSDASLENEKIHITIESIKTEAEREKQLIESKAKALQMSAEVDLRSRLEEWKWKLEQAKKDVMGYVGLQFCSIFDVNEKIDENNFENFLKGLRALMEKQLTQEKNLRQLLLLGPNQSIENAVSNLLLESKQKL